MDKQLDAIRFVRLSEETNNLINHIVDVLNDKNIIINGGRINGSLLLRYPFEKIAHTSFRHEKIEPLTELLLFAHRPSTISKVILTKEEMMKIIEDVVK